MDDVFVCRGLAGAGADAVLVCDGGTTSLMSLVRDFRERSKNRFGTGYVPGV